MNIFIAEDEYWALEELKALLKKYEDEHNLYYFPNGEEAFQYFKNVTPDLLITDITMPLMDGLQLIKKTKAVNPSVECILLTVHDTFSYAQRGIQLGVADYLLKPVKKEELYKTVDRMITEIRKKKREEKDRQHWSINKMLIDSIQQKNYDIQELDSQRFLFMYTLFGNWLAPIIDMEKIEVQTIKEIVGDDRACWSLPISGRQKVLLIELKPKEKLESFPLQEIHRYHQQFGQAHTFTLVKNENIPLNEIFQNATLQLEKGKLFGRPTAVTELTPIIEPEISHLWDKVRVIEHKLVNREFANVDEQIGELYKQLIAYPLTQRQLFRFLMDMYYALQYNLQQSTRPVMQLDEMDDYFDKLNRLVSYEELEDWLHGLVYKLTETTQSDQQVAPKHLIPKVKQWIEESYQQSITFQQFADEHHVSLSYLSREFKEQTGLTFSEYLVKVRINQAKAFFQEGVDRTVVVAELVGYHDVKHFRNVFKKMTGLTPTEYKESIKEEG
ncbi:YesN/AraC family two-component response regulator [Gracilibacillus halotolerans]|uniref:YesN/AraC family two-component response regulator n=1 Tax=Gracilibacillus halotolerans TaxID=74386 RepID=A0A841RMH0_9BACI|nr:response regulator [Gracilibacillus halotolerans]MBB6512823.1 YesN/AraC family two-component response regulator [Gracilibacillus halotolerans]